MIPILVFIAAAAVGLHAFWAKKRGRFDPVVLVGDAIVAGGLLILVVEGSSFFLNYSWWKELGQEQTFWQYVRIRWEPQTAAVVLGFVVLAAALRLGRRHSVTALPRKRLFTWLGHAAALVVSFFLAVNLIDPWRVALWLGSRDTALYRDPLFGHSLTFYLFRLPFYRMIFTWAGFLLVLALIFYGVTVGVGASGERLDALREQFEARARGYRIPLPPAGPMLSDFAGLARVGAVLLLVLYAVGQYFARYDLLYSNHDFLYGADYVDARIGVPLIWAQVVAALALALLVAFVRRRRGRWLIPGQWPVLRALGIGPELIAGFMAIVILPPIITSAVHSIYVRPNELTLERPYIVDHIAATRSAYGIQKNSKEEEFTPRQDATFNLAQYPDTSDNLRLWDWRPFQDNITQLQALRPYYDFPNVDLDRYDINGEKRQVMIAARSLDTNLLPDSAQTWVNLHLQYTHGYGAVAGLVNEASSEGEPQLILQDAPPQTKYTRFRMTRPQIYFGEQTRTWVFVDTSQAEFDYPRGDDNAYNTYDGTAGIPMPNLGTRLLAAIAENDTNILLTDYLTPKSKLLLHRQIVERVQRLAPFLLLDPDPYLVVDHSGRLFWMLDAYTTSDSHPYSEPLDLGDREINYIRNSVKITVDAYNGTVHFYVFDNEDPILAAYRRVFPQLFLPRSAMPSDLVQHIRYPELLFSTQAEIYRIYHMTDPRVFYNKEDQWDVAKQIVTQGQTQQTQPYYVMMQLPGTQKAEFVLMLPFTSHNRDNMIAWIAARCDPANYGQILFYRLPKDQLIYGPLQIQSRVDQNRDISKDLSLWNQQGSRVIRGTTLVLPVGNTFVYVEPIYIQATQARLPELKKVVLAAGNRIVYADDLPEAIAQLAQPEGGTAQATAAAATQAPAVISPPVNGHAAIPVSVLESIQKHLENYQKLTATGQLAQAGQELEAIRKETQDALAQPRPPKSPTKPEQPKQQR
ncbi:MAG: UPF0182 family protein [Acidobacteriota bacterium]|nr:UPF0182 family protein [Acidobacteriota bacterium]